MTLVVKGLMMMMMIKEYSHKPAYKVIHMSNHTFMYTVEPLNKADERQSSTTAMYCPPSCMAVKLGT